MGAGCAAGCCGIDGSSAGGGTAISRAFAASSAAARCVRRASLRSCMFSTTNAATAAAGLLGGHVMHLALEHAGGGLADQPVLRFGDPEIDHLRSAGGGDDHVVRGHVTVNDPERLAVGVAELVGGMEPRGYVRHHAQ